MIDPKEKKEFLETVLRTFKSQYNSNLTVDDLELIIDKKISKDKIRFLVYTKPSNDNLKFHIYFKGFGKLTEVRPFNLELEENYHTGLSGVFYVSNCELNEDQFPSIKKYLSSTEFINDAESLDLIVFEDDSGALVEEDTNNYILLEI